MSGRVRVTVEEKDLRGMTEAICGLRRLPIDDELHERLWISIP